MNALREQLNENDYHAPENHNRKNIWRNYFWLQMQILGF